MPRPKTNPNARSHHKKPAPPAPELEAMVDTLVDSTNPDEMRVRAPARQKPGAKKVHGITTKIMGDGLAVGVKIATYNPDPRKNLTQAEAQSIGHPVVRMLARRVPGWVKPFLPKTSLSPEDTADIEEILATIAKWGVRLLTIAVNDIFAAKEQAQATRQQKQAAHGPVVAPRPAQASLHQLQAEQREAMVIESVPAANGHNPAFDVLNNVDLGVEAI